MNIIKKIHYTPEILRLAVVYYLKALGVVSAGVTIFSYAYGSPIFSPNCIVVSCGIICLIYTIFRMLPTKRALIYLAPHKKVELLASDLFCQDGIIVIPVNNYFDMTTERDVIGEKSVHGQFIKRYENKYNNIDINEKIKETLGQDGIVPKSINKERKFPKNYNQYELGTVARVFENNDKYYLTVVSEFDSNNHIIPQPEMFGLVLQRMLKSINVYRSGNDVYMPVIGAGLMNMPMRLDEMIEFILDNIKFCTEYNSSVGCIHIVVREQDLDKVSFRVIQNHKSSIFNKFYQ